MSDSASQKLTKKSLDGTLRALSSAVGDFIRYWGFRRIHGQIWTQVFLSVRPLSGADLSRRLRVSKALISPALGELEAYGLIHQSGGDGKTKTYAANPEVFEVIREILMKRETQLIRKAADFYQKLARLQGEASTASEIDRERMERLGGMIDSATEALDLVIELSKRTESETL